MPNAGRSKSHPISLGFVKSPIDQREEPSHAGAHAEVPAVPPVGTRYA